MAEKCVSWKIQIKRAASGHWFGALLGRSACNHYKPSKKGAALRNAKLK
jgi:hypothetical protein